MEEKDVIEFLNYLCSLSYIGEEETICIREKAQLLLRKNLKDKIQIIFDYSLTSSCYRDRNRKVVKEGNLIAIIATFADGDDKQKFLENNIDRLYLVIELLQEIVEELEKEEEKDLETEE